MIMREEEYHSVKKTYKFPCDLTDSQKYPNIPKKIRDNAKHCLKNYPSQTVWGDINETVGFFNPR